MSVEPGGVELLTKTFHPLVVKNADTNFIQTLAFVASLSRTAEVNTRGVQRLASKLTHVQPDVQQAFSEVITGVSQRSATLPAYRDTSSATELSRRPDATVLR